VWLVCYIPTKTKTGFLCVLKFGKGAHKLTEELNAWTAIYPGQGAFMCTICNEDALIMPFVRIQKVEVHKQEELKKHFHDSKYQHTDLVDRHIGVLANGNTCFIDLGGAKKM